MVARPPGASKVIFVKLTYFIISRDSMKDKPVSEAPTTTILVLFYVFEETNCFLDNIDRENGAYYSSYGSLPASTAPLFVRCLCLSSNPNWKFHFFFKK